MQDVVTKKNKEEVVAAGMPQSQEVLKPLPRPRSRPQVIEESLEVPRERPTKKEESTENGDSGGAPSFAPIDSSPIFEKMKQHNKDRESFSDEFSNSKRNGGKKLIGQILLFLATIGGLGAFFYGIFFYDAVVSVTPKSADVALLNQGFVAGGNATSTVPLHLMTLSGEESTELTATGEKNVSTKASGKIVIFNDFDSRSQRLVKNTRFQTTDGKIYRINESVEVPGQKTVSGKTTPGSLEVTVYADVPGAEYNIDLADFTVPGFKGSPRYDKFYARSKTPMTGGFSGLTKVVSDADVQTARATLLGTLKDKLLADALAQKPKNTVLYKEAVFYSFADQTDNAAGTANADSKTVKFILKGDITAAFFDTTELSNAIIAGAAAPVETSEGDAVLVSNLESLSFSLKDPATPKEGDTMPFILSGNAHAVWQIDTSILQSKLAGAKKSDYMSIFAGVRGVKKATAEIHPFWKTKFPSNPAKIRVEIVEESQ
ncbi:MAG: hypothetical protein HYT94_05005 [Parcubacteria group bacterium]|nr:hypothetical protein [Parcubacteria group bacterium]